MDFIKAISKEGETIDEICFRVLDNTAHVVEAVYQANPHLSNTKLFLPAGIELLIPTNATPAVIEYNLWL